VTPDAFRAELSRLGLSQQAAARVLEVTDRTLRRWARAGAPRAVELALAKMTPTEARRLQKAPDG
jgi:DNA-binding transcriptional regulator YiaG